MSKGQTMYNHAVAAKKGLHNYEAADRIWARLEREESKKTTRTFPNKSKNLKTVSNGK